MTDRFTPDRRSSRLVSYRLHLRKSRIVVAIRETGARKQWINDTVFCVAKLRVHPISYCAIHVSRRNTPCCAFSEFSAIKHVVIKITLERDKP